MNLTESDFERAAALAIAYLGRSSSLICTAADYLGYCERHRQGLEAWTRTLTDGITGFCDVLGTDRGRFESVEHYLLLAAAEMRGGEPVRHGPFTATTAHNLVWEFAFEIFLQIYSTISHERISKKNSDCRLDHGDVESFRLDPKFVKEHAAAIRDNLRQFKPINYERFSVMIRLESTKAAALFATGQAIASDGTGEGAPRWSKPDSPTNWSAVFNVSYNKMRKLLKSQIIKNKKLGERLYMIELDDLPADSS